MNKPAASVLLLLLTALAACVATSPPPRQAAARISSRFTDLMLGDPASRKHMQAGFFTPNGYWTYTSRVFRFTMDPPRSDGHSVFLELEFVLPDELLSEYPDVKLTGRVNGVEVGRETYRASGPHLFTAQVPDLALHSQAVTVEFELNRGFKNWQNGGLYGIIAVRATLEPFEATEEWRATQIDRARAEYRRIQDGRAKMPAGRLAGLDRSFRSLPGWNKVSFHGIAVPQNPLDLWVLQQLIYEVRPVRVVEIGTAQGGAALYLAQVMEGVGLRESLVVTVDPVDRTQAAVREPLWRRVRFQQGEPEDPGVVRAVTELAAAGRTLVVLNHDGSNDRLLARLKSYAPLVAPGSYLVVANTNPGGPARTGPDAGTQAVIERFLREPAGAEFAPEPTREMFLTSWNTGGWLKRRAAAPLQAGLVGTGGAQ